MLRSTSFAATALSLSLAACSSDVTNPGTGGGGSASTSTTGGSGGATTSEGGSGGTAPVDAGPDAPPGSCVTEADCPPTGNPCVGSPCVDGMCGTPVAAFDFAACDDGNPCTENDYCSKGVCTGSLIPCEAASSCNIGACDPVLGCIVVGTVADGVPCEGNACVGAGICAGGVCSGGAQMDCSFLDGACSQGVCDPQQGCIAAPKPNGAACDDGNPCTTNTTCNNGACSGGQGPTIYFTDDFHDNSKGWTLGPEWQIGSAMTSSGQQSGNPDPAQDHTPTADNGVAGVMIGGNNSITPLHPFYYLTSPPFNTAGAAGAVVLSFYRFLNSDFEPWTTNTIEVWNGTIWVQVWKSGGQPIEDMQWTLVSHDITAYKNNAMKVRFGFDVAQDQAYATSSWNIDDVMVSSGVCP